LFSVSGLTDVPLSEIRAEVLSYTLTSNDLNECLGCKTYPFTWASIQSAGNIGTVNPVIPLYAGTSTTLFNPIGTAIYQNPREVVWNNGSPFTIAGTMGINFLIPPPPIIDYCVLSGKICMKFTFRDINCKECDVIVCFDFEVKNGNQVNFVKQ